MASSVIASTELRLAPQFTAHQGKPRWLRHRVQNVMDECFQRGQSGFLSMAPLLVCMVGSRLHAVRRIGTVRCGF